MRLRRLSASAVARLAKHWESAGAPPGMIIDRPPPEWLQFVVKVQKRTDVDPNYIGQTRPEIAAILSGMVALGWNVHVYDGTRAAGAYAVRTFLRMSRWAGGGGMLLPLERAAIFDHGEVFDFSGEVYAHEQAERKARVAALRAKAKAKAAPKRTPRFVGRGRERYAQRLDWLQPLHELAHIALIEREREAGRDPRVMPDPVGLELDCAIWEIKLVMAVWGVLSPRARALVAAQRDNHNPYKLHAAWPRVPGPDPRLVLAVRRAYARAVEGRWAAIDDSRY